MSSCGPNCNCHIFHQETYDEVENSIISDNKIQQVADFFKVMGDFTRVKIMEAVKDHELCVCDLAHLLGVTKSAISHQMRTLRKYNIVTSEKKGKMVYYSLNQSYVSDIIESANNYTKENL